MIRLLKLYCIFAIFLSACNNKNPHENELIGEWERFEIRRITNDTSYVISYHISILNGFRFNDNGTVEYKDGFFKENSISKNGVIYLGNMSKYKLSKDSLTIYKPDTGIPQSYKLLKLSADTLAFLFDGKEMYFKKVIPEKYKNKEADNIIFSSSGCYGSCSSLTISIDSNANIIFIGRHFVDKIGIYQGKADKEVFQNILSEINKTNINQLHKRYILGGTDRPTYYTLLTNNNAISKSIFDYGGAAPKTWLWTYPSLQYLYQKVPLKKLDLPQHLLCLALGDRAQLTKKDSVLNLTPTEMLYLMCKLKAGKACVPKPLPYKLKINEVNYPVYDIETDGRYYSFKPQKGGTNITIDIGFDLLKQQINADGWEERTEYDLD